MKKALVLLLALAFVGAFAFADNAPAPQGQFHSWNEGQFILAASINNGPTVTGWGPNWDSVKAIDQEWGFTYDGKDFGFDATLEFGADNFGNELITSSGQYGAQLSWFGTYYKIDKYAKLYFGKPRQNEFTNFTYIGGNPIEQRLMDGQAGANIDLYPIDNLTIEGVAFVPFVGIATSSAPQVNFADNFSIGAKYVIPNTANVILYYKALQNSYTSDSSGTNMKYVDFEAQYTGIPKVGIQGGVVYHMDNIGGSTSNVSEPLKVYIGATTSMIDSLNLTLDAFVQNYPTGTTIGGTSIGTATTVFTAEVNAQYAIGSTPWALGVNVGYDGGAGQFNSGNGETPVAGTTGAGFLLYPYVAYNVAGGVVKLGFVYVAGGVNNALTGNTATNPAWALPIVYVWSF